jgi:small subunit ribosomal protein S20
MPVTKSAKKALRQDRRRAISNQLVRQQLKQIISKTKGKRTPKELAEFYRVLDRAAKRGVIHKNKAAKFKSRLAKITSTTLKPKINKKTKK